MRIFGDNFVADLPPYCWWWKNFENWSAFGRTYCYGQKHGCAFCDWGGQSPIFAARCTSVFCLTGLRVYCDSVAAVGPPARKGINLQAGCRPTNSVCELKGQERNWWHRKLNFTVKRPLRESSVKQASYWSEVRCIDFNWTKIFNRLKFLMID